MVSETNKEVSNDLNSKRKFSQPGFSSEWPTFDSQIQKFDLLKLDKMIITIITIYHYQLYYNTVPSCKLQSSE